MQEGIKIQEFRSSTVISEGGVRQAIEACGAFRSGHFLYTNGDHGAHYVEKFRILENPKLTASLASQIANHFGDSQIDLVAGPTLGGVVLAFEVARQLDVNAVYLERSVNGSRVLRRGFDIEPHAKILVVDDVVTTGGSVRQVIDCIELANGRVVGVGILVDRAGGLQGLAMPLYSCLTVDLPTYPATACPLCATKVPLQKPGSKGH